MEKSWRECAPKASPRAPFNFGKLPKTAVACKKNILKEDDQKALKMLTLSRSSLRM